MIDQLLSQAAIARRINMINAMSQHRDTSAPSFDTCLVGEGIAAVSQATHNREAFVD